MKLSDATRKFTAAEYGTLDTAMLAAKEFFDIVHDFEAQFELKKGQDSLPGDILSGEFLLLLQWFLMYFRTFVIPL